MEHTAQLSTRTRSMKLCVCPVCADVVSPATGACAKNCAWPPPGAAINSRASPPQADDLTANNSAWLARCPAGELTVTAACLRSFLGDIRAELARRRSSAVGCEAALGPLLTQLTPVRWPRQASTGDEVERAAAEACRVPLEAARGYLPGAGFWRLRRVTHGRNTWLYRFRFPGHTQQLFVRYAG